MVVLRSVGTLCRAQGYGVSPDRERNTCRAPHEWSPMIQADTSWVSRMVTQESESAAHIRILVLYVPIVLCAIAWLLRKPRIRTIAAPLLSLLWTLPTLLILQRLNLYYHWWSFDTQTPCFLGMPVALYLGWAVFWGLLPQLAWTKLDVLS